MPPKGTKHIVATGTTARTTKNPIIAKECPSRPAVTTIVRAAIASAGPRHRIVTIPLALSRTPSMSSHSSSQQSLSHVVTQIEAMQVAFAEVKSIQEGTFNLLEEIKERLEAVETNITTVTAVPTIPVAQTNQGLNGMTPSQFMQLYLPWIDTTTLANLVSLDLDVAHFIKLIPRKERPKGQANAGMTSGVHFDGETGKTSIISESNIQYEKQFPDYQTLINALTVYAVIRDLFDVDKLGFGSAITLYIRQLTYWTKYHNWSSVISYFVSHFDKYQSSKDPRTWIDVDVQLFTQYMSKDTIDPPTVAKNKLQTSNSKTTTVCKNFNIKGCSWKYCNNLHVCQNCHSADHTALHYSQKPKST